MVEHKYKEGDTVTITWGDANKEATGVITAFGNLPSGSPTVTVKHDKGETEVLLKQIEQDEPWDDAPYVTYIYSKKD